MPRSKFEVPFSIFDGQVQTTVEECPRGEAELYKDESMHVECNPPTTERRDPRAFVMTLSLVIIVLTYIAVMTTQIGVPLI